MNFSQLIKELQHSEAGLIEHEIGTDPKITSGASIDNSTIDQVTFLEEGNALNKLIGSTKAGAIILPSQDSLISMAKSRNLPFAVFKNPRIAFAETLALLHPKTIPLAGIHPSAVIAESVLIDNKKVSIGANVSISERCKIGDGSIIHPGVVIYSRVSIGENCEIHANSVIHQGTSIGNNCVIHSNAVIGSEGFGFVPTKNGWKKMPQTGLVILEDNIEIGCNSSIDRPAVGETRIGSGTKIDNLVQIGHGVTTGKDCAMAAQVGIAGGAQIGNGVILAGQVGVGNRVKVGDKVIASSKCGIHADVEPGEVVSGFPALPNRLWLRCSANFKKLPEITKTIKQISQRSINNLKDHQIK